MLAVYLAPVYIIVNSYLLFRIHKWLGACHVLFGKLWMRMIISLVYVFLAVTPLIAFFLPAGGVRRILMLTGNYWLGILLYLVLAVLAADVVCLFRFLITRKRIRHSALWGGICAGLVILVSLWGIWQARDIHVTPYEITVAKDGGALDDLNVVLIADLHLGYNIGTARMSDMVEKINEQNADLVVIAGDIFDNEYEALDDPDKLADILRGIQSKYGVYACYGNHDVEEKILAGFTFGGSGKKESSRQMDGFLEKAGIRLLRDEAVWIADSFYLYGRADAQKPGRGIRTRKTADRLAEELDTGRPVIVAEHEPQDFQELAECGTDVVLCGHTHDGQMFPANLIMKFLWENSYGYLKKDTLHTIVTSGVGLFGPNMRVGTIAEICRIKIHFQ